MTSRILKCSPSVDEAAVAALEERYRLILQQPDNKLVAFSDPTEVERVKNDFLKKKLGLTDEAAIAAALAHMGQLMSDEIDKNRLTVYDVLADHFGKLDAIKALDDSGTTPREAGIRLRMPASCVCAKAQNPLVDLTGFPLVDLTGFEPVTSSMRTKRATNCAIGP